MNSIVFTVSHSLFRICDGDALAPFQGALEILNSFSQLQFLPASLAFLQRSQYICARDVHSLSVDGVQQFL